MSPRLGSGEGGRVGRRWNVMYSLLDWGANVEGRGDDQEKKFLIDNTTQALIPSGDISLPENVQVFSNPTSVYSFFQKKEM